MATENLMMAAVQAGGDRQQVHEIVRRHSHAITQGIKDGTASPAELLDRLKGEAAFAKVNFAAVLDPRKFVGRAPEQAAEYLEQAIAPIRQRYANSLGMTVELNV